MFFNRYGGENVAVTDCMSQYSMSVSTNATVKFDNGNTVYAQRIGIILCCFPNCAIIYLVGPVYYCPGHPSNTISLGALKFYVGFQNITPEPLEHCDFVESKGRSWRSPHQTKKIRISSNINLSNSTLKETGILLSQLSVPYQNRIFLRLLIRDLVISLFRG